MRGVIESYDSERDFGIVRGNDGKPYSFTAAVIHDVELVQPHIPLIFYADGANVTEAVPQPSITTENFGTAEYQEIDEASGPGPLGYFFRVWLRYFQFSGRAQRVEFWSFWLIFYAIAVGVLVLESMLSVGVVGFAWTYLLLFLAVLCPGLALNWRRLHDVGLGGAGALLFGVPLIGWSMALFVVSVLPSQRNTNRYGPHPKAAARSGAREDRLAEVFT